MVVCLSACRDGMVMLLPLTFVRVAITVILNSAWAYWPQAWMPAGVPWGSLASQLDVTLAIALLLQLGTRFAMGRQMLIAHT